MWKRHIYTTFVRIAKSTVKMAKGISFLYLFAYNAACCLGWLYVLQISVRHIANKSIDTIWDEAEFPLKVVQTAACLEIIHSLLGLVKSPWVTTALQVFSRVWTVWAVMHVAPPAQTSVFTALAITSWGLVEVPRYLFYALNLVDAVPYPLLWLRYSLFAVLYPTGITGELGCMWMALLFFLQGRTKMDSILTLPQQNLMAIFLIVLVGVTYIPGSPKMYGHMVKARKKALFPSAEGSKKKTKKET